MRRTATADTAAATAALERELVHVHFCIDVLGVERLLWLREAFVDRSLRLACSLDSTRRGWSTGG